MTIHRRVLVHGRVQGVFFRDSCRVEAERLQVAGWVTNRPDGAVEAVLDGEPAAVEAMVGWMGHGPPRAQVSAVEVTEAEPTGETGFRVR